MPARPYQRHVALEYPHRVNLPVPEGGWGAQLDALMAWCNAKVGQGAWRHIGGWHFKRAEDARAFAARWGGQAAANQG